MSAILSSGVIDHLWESSLFALAACFLIYAFRKGSAWSRHFIAWVAYAKFLLPLALLSAYFPKTIIAEQTGNTALLEAIPTLQALSIGLDFEYWLDKMAAGGNGAEPVPSAFPWTQVLLILWIGISVALIARRWIRHIRYKRDIERLSFPADERWMKLAREIGGKRALPKLVVGRDDSFNAGVFGLTSCVIVIPKIMDTIFNADDREVFLRHELQHAFKYDNLWFFVQKCIRDVFWFHPLVCWLDRQISWEREMMRDEEVLNETQNKTTYLNCLMKASKIELPHPSATSLALNGSPFARRIKAIAAYKPNTWSKAISACASVATIALLLSIFIVSTKTLQAEEKQRMTDSEVNANLEKGIQDTRDKIKEGKTKTEPDLSESEKIIIKEVTALLKTDKAAPINSSSKA